MFEKMKQEFESQDDAWKKAVWKEVVTDCETLIKLLWKNYYANGIPAGKRVRKVEAKRQVALQKIGELDGLKASGVNMAENANANNAQVELSAHHVKFVEKGSQALSSDANTAGDIYKLEQSQQVAVDLHKSREDKSRAVVSQIVVKDRTDMAADKEVGVGAKAKQGIDTDDDAIEIEARKKDATEKRNDKVKLQHKELEGCKNASGSFPVIEEKRVHDDTADNQVASHSDASTINEVRTLEQGLRLAAKFHEIREDKKCAIAPSEEVGAGAKIKEVDGIATKEDSTYEKTVIIKKLEKKVSTKEETSFKNKKECSNEEIEVDTAEEERNNEQEAQAIVKDVGISKPHENKGFKALAVSCSQARGNEDDVQERIGKRKRKLGSSRGKRRLGNPVRSESAQGSLRRMVLYKLQLDRRKRKRLRLHHRTAMNVLTKRIKKKTLSFRCFSDSAKESMDNNDRKSSFEYTESGEILKEAHIIEERTKNFFTPATHHLDWSYDSQWVGYDDEVADEKVSGQETANLYSKDNGSTNRNTGHAEAIKNKEPGCANEEEDEVGKIVKNGASYERRLSFKERVVTLEESGGSSGSRDEKAAKFGDVAQVNQSTSVDIKYDVAKKRPSATLDKDSQERRRKKTLPPYPGTSDSSGRPKFTTPMLYKCRIRFHNEKRSRTMTMSAVKSLEEMASKRIELSLKSAMDRRKPKAPHQKKQVASFFNRCLSFSHIVNDVVNNLSKNTPDTIPYLHNVYANALYVTCFAYNFAKSDWYAGHYFKRPKKDEVTVSSFDRAIEGYIRTLHEDWSPLYNDYTNIESLPTDSVAHPPSPRLEPIDEGMGFDQGDPWKSEPESSDSEFSTSVSEFSNSSDAIIISDDDTEVLDEEVSNNPLDNIVDSSPDLLPDLDTPSLWDLQQQAATFRASLDTLDLRDLRQQATELRANILNAYLGSL